MQLEIVMSTPGVLEVVVEIFFFFVFLINFKYVSHSLFYIFSVIKFETGSTTVAARLSYKNIGSNYFIYFFVSMMIS